MNVIVKPVITTSQKNNFIKYPYQLYADCSFWVPPLLISQRELLNKNNPFWKANKHQFFLAHSGNQIVGRIAAFTNIDHNDYFRTNDGFFGFLEAIDQEVVFLKLFEAAESFLTALGCKKIIGPMNPTIHHEVGVLTKGFEEPPYFMLTYNYPYYHKHILQAGYKKIKDFNAYKLKTTDFQFTEKIARVKNSIQKKYALTIRTPRMGEFITELRVFHNIYNNSFLNHWGFSPINWNEFQFLGKDLKFVLDKEMILIAEMHGKPVGFLLAIPNLNEALSKIKNGKLLPFGLFKLLYFKGKIKSLRVITIAIIKEYQHLGIGSILYPEIAYRAKICGYQNTELSWVVDDNVKMTKICNDVGGIVAKVYCLYQKDIGIPSI